jgi:pilus assembly protein Flp/PilA
MYLMLLDLRKMALNESLLRHHYQGQGIVEYLPIIALVAFAATSGMSALSSGVNSAMTGIASVPGAYVQ